MPLKLRGGDALVKDTDFNSKWDTRMTAKNTVTDANFQSKFDTALASADVGGGKVLQVKNTLTSSRNSYTATNNNVGTNISPLNTAITPSATSSKVWITITITFEMHHDTVFELYRNSTVIGRNTASSSRFSGTFLPSYDVDNGSTPRTNTYTYLDSPNTTSAITYKLYCHSASGSNRTLRLNRSMNNAGADNHEIATSSMTLMEIGA
jgi:archaellin